MGTGKQIKRLRLQQRLSADKAAGMIGVSPDRLRKWENNAVEPRAEDARIIEEYFGVTLDKLETIDRFNFFPKLPISSVGDISTAYGTTEVYKDKYIVALEQQVADLRSSLKEIEEIQSHLADLRQTSKANLAYSKTMYQFAQRQRAELDHIPLKKAKADMDRELAEIAKEILEKGSNGN